jgi:hypothetical protein
MLLLWNYYIAILMFLAKVSGYAAFVTTVLGEHGITRMNSALPNVSSSRLLGFRLVRDGSVVSQRR